MKVVTAAEMQRIDRITIDNIGIPGEVLMGYAGKSVADYILSVKNPGKTAIFSGTGNNGGDGFVTAYFLLNKGFQPDIYIGGDIGKVSGTSKIYLDICRNSNINIVRLDEERLKEINLEEYDLIIDALLGTGFKGTARGIVKDIISKINQCSKDVLSVDLPSGLPSDGEAPEGEVINADYTVTIGLPKVSLVTYPGIKYTGTLVVSDIGFPPVLTHSRGLCADLLDKEYIRSHLDISRDLDSHKGSAGHLLFAGGFDNMEGAIVMSAMAAFETGIGLGTLLTTPAAREKIACRIPELITRSLDPLSAMPSRERDNDENLAAEIEKDLKTFFNEDRRYDAMVIGPGMGRSMLSELFFNAVIDNLEASGIKKVLIDGDGLYHLSAYLKNNKLPQNISFIITPHFGEASRLIDRPLKEIKDNRLSSARDLAVKTSSVALLKGPSTIITDGKNSLINTTGNQSLSTGGSGDILSGIIGGLMLRDINCLDSAGIGAYIHGLAADMHVKENNLSVLKATDLMKYIRIAIEETIN